MWLFGSNWRSRPGVEDEKATHADSSPKQKRTKHAHRNTTHTPNNTQSHNHTHTCRTRVGALAAGASLGVWRSLHLLYWRKGTAHQYPPSQWRTQWPVQCSASKHVGSAINRVSVCACVSVCVSVCLYVCTHACTNYPYCYGAKKWPAQGKARRSVGHWESVYVCACGQTYEHACLHACVCVVCVSVCVWVCVCAFLCVCKCVSCMLVRVHMRECRCV